MFDNKDDFNLQSGGEGEPEALQSEKAEDVAAEETKAAQPETDSVYEAPESQVPFTNEFAVPEKPKKKHTFLKVAAGALIAGVVFGAASSFTSGIISDHRSIETTQNLYVSKSDGTAVPSGSIEDIVESCLPSVVSITNKGISELSTFFGTFQQESTSTGTGIIIGKNETELLIVTNYHVVADSKELTVVFAHDSELENDENDTSYMNIAQVKGYDADKDVAVIAVKLEDISDDTMNNIAIATMGDSNSIRLGSEVIAIGNALGYGQSVTNGIISALNREITMQNANGVTVTNTFIQTNAAINSGNSGGALLNMAGEVIGINSAKISSTGVEGMGYAIPISDVEDLIGDLMTMQTREEVDEEDRGYIGIEGADISSTASMMYGLPVGVSVNTVVEGSPADKAGIRVRDIIVKFDNTTISGMSELQSRLTYYRKGETVKITVKRPSGSEYEDVELEITLGSKEEAGIE